MLTNGLPRSLVRLFGAAVYYLLLAVVAGAALVALGVPVNAVLAVAFVVVVVLAVALQQSASNLAATVIFLLFQPFKRGELVATMGHMGTVQEILLFNTVVTSVTTPLPGPARNGLGGLGGGRRLAGTRPL